VARGYCFAVLLHNANLVQQYDACLIPSVLHSAFDQARITVAHVNADLSTFNAVAV
jgi:hypothetical protein